MKSDVFSINDGPKYNYLQWNEKVSPNETTLIKYSFILNFFSNLN